MNKKTKLFFLGLFVVLFLSTIAYALPTGPVVTYISNTTLASVSASRNEDAKGTITTVTMSATQQDYKWKAYVGNVTGRFVLDDASAKAIYDWSLGSVTGKVFATRSSAVNWGSVSCVNQSVIDSEEGALGTTSSGTDSINTTFNYTIHRNFLVGTLNITNSSCRSTYTYINGTPQNSAENASFQEILLKDNVSSNLVYTTLINPGTLGYNGVSLYDFQMLVAENESSNVPTTYFFYVELG